MRRCGTRWALSGVNDRLSRVDAALRWVSACAGVSGRSLSRSCVRTSARVRASGSTNCVRAALMRCTCAQALTKASDSRRLVSASRESLCSAHRSSAEMEGLRRSSRSALVRERGWFAEVGLGEVERPHPSSASPNPPSPQGRGRSEEAPSVTLARDPSPGSPGEERLNAVLKSYSANRFDVCILELSRTACAAQARRWVRPRFCARTRSVWSRFLNAEISKGSKRDTQRRQRREERDGWPAQADLRHAGGGFGSCMCLDCFKDMQETSSPAWHPEVSPIVNDIDHRADLDWGFALGLRV